MIELVRTPGVKPTKTPSLEARMRRGLLTMLLDRLEDVEREICASPLVKTSYGALRELVARQEDDRALEEAINGYATDVVPLAYLRGIREGMELARRLSGEALAAVAGVLLLLDFPSPDDFELAEFGIAGTTDSTRISRARRPGSTAANDEAEDPSPKAASSATE